MTILMFCKKNTVSQFEVNVLKFPYTFFNLGSKGFVKRKILWRIIQKKKIRKSV